MSETRYEVRVGTYFDSIVLMQLQKSLTELPGVVDAGVVMATEANRDLLRAAGLPIDDVAANPDDLVIVVSGDSAETAQTAIDQVDELMRSRGKGAGGTGGFRPKSLKNAASMLPSAEWVLISVPGRYAAGVADEALNLGKHVFLYSDNVSIEDEKRLKAKAAEKGLMVMGPDCGTAIVNGIGLGFANRVQRGNIGVIAASGTGLQAVTSQLHNFGAGVSQAIGTGGRDLKDAIGGTTMLQAINLLADDPKTDCIVLVSKPPSPAVQRKIYAAARETGKQVIVYMIGSATPAPFLHNLHFAQSLSDAAGLADEQSRCRNAAI